MTAPNSKKVILVTGSTSGIGRSVAKSLLVSGHTVVIAGRNSKRIDEAIAWIDPSEEARKRVHSILLNLESLESIRSSVEEFKALNLQLDVLINNAGITGLKLQYVPDTTTVERTFFVNAVAPFYLSLLLAPLMQPGGRVHFVTSTSHDARNQLGNGTDALLSSEFFNMLDGKPEYEGFKYYRMSKLAMVWIAYVMAKQFPDLGVIAFCPGYIPDTELGREYPPEMAAQIKLKNQHLAKPEKQYLFEYEYYATSEELNNVTGVYFQHGKRTESSERSYNMDDAIKFWNIGCDICNTPKYKQKNF